MKLGGKFIIILLTLSLVGLVSTLAQPKSAEYLAFQQPIETAHAASPVIAPKPTPPVSPSPAPPIPTQAKHNELIWSNSKNVISYYQLNNSEYLQIWQHQPQTENYQLLLQKTFNFTQQTLSNWQWYDFDNDQQNEALIVWQTGESVRYQIWGWHNQRWQEIGVDQRHDYSYDMVEAYNNHLITIDTDMGIVIKRELVNKNNKLYFRIVK